MSRLPFVSLIVPCRNESGHIRAFLESLLRQDYPPDLLEIVVADGLSDDGTREIVAAYGQEQSNLKLIDNPKKIAATGLNAGIRAARGEIIVRADVHTEYASDYVSQCVRTYHQTKADNVGGPWVAHGEGYVGKAIRGVFQSTFGSGGARSRRESYEGETDTVYLGCWPRETFEKYGMFDECLVRNQDDEHNLRIVRGGGRIWQSPRISSRYHTRNSLRLSAKQNFQYGFWKVAVLRKHLIPATIRQLVPAAWVLSLFLLLAWEIAEWIFGPIFGTLRARHLLLLDMVPYAGLCLIASLHIARSQGWKLLPILPIAFASYHFCYGLGFLLGLGYWLTRDPNRAPESRLVSGLSR
jgi:succinoglycan biosynthesis protein ExoA